MWQSWPCSKQKIWSSFPVCDFLSGVRASRIVTWLLIVDHDNCIKIPPKHIFYEFLHLSGNLSILFLALSSKYDVKSRDKKPNFCSCNNLELRFKTKSKCVYKIIGFPLALLSALLLVMLSVGRAPKYSSLPTFTRVTPPGTRPINWPAA